MTHGYLQSHIVSLVSDEWATTPDSIEAWLNVRYRTSRRAILVTLWRLTQRGILTRQRRGVYRVAQ